MMVWILILSLITLLSLFIYMYREAFGNRVVYHTLEFSAFPESFRTVKLFFISDIHRRTVSDSIIDEVKGNVDVVIVGGDLLEKGVPLERVKNNIMKLKTLGPVLFVWGNNDYEGDVPVLDAMLLSLDVKVLVNDSILFQSEEGERLYFIGLDEVSKDRHNLELAMEEVELDSFKILVCHNPEIRREIEPKYGINLLLSGHTHGGQIRLFGYGPYEKGSLKKIDELTVLISNGYGTTGIPFRLGAKAETHLITIKHET
ncbi:metallophosphoesterase family protein [Niallia sp. XMNu-256]|uniref:metallophosphoesterase n=1 Tax=Niallia sp. XMNu-256 TaxID=3082444 RepID=UPI0030D41EE3